MAVANFGRAGPDLYGPWAKFLKPDYDPDVDIAPAKFFVAWELSRPGRRCEVPRGSGVVVECERNFSTAARCLLNLDEPDTPEEAMAFVETLEWLKAIDWATKSEYGFLVDAEIHLSEMRRKYQ